MHLVLVWVVSGVVHLAQLVLAWVEQGVVHLGFGGVRCGSSCLGGVRCGSILVWVE